MSVCWPVKARFLCTKRRAHIGVIGVCLFSFLYNIPRWLEFHTESITSCLLVDLSNSTTSCSLTTITYQMKQSLLRSDPTYKTVYIFWAYFVVMFLIPFTTLTYFNFEIFRAVSISFKNIFSTKSNLFIEQ